MWKRHLGSIRRYSPKQNLKMRIADQFTHPHTVQGLRPENSRSRKCIECSPWTLSNTHNLSWPHLLLSCLARTELFAFASTTISWTQWRSGIPTRYHAWTNESIRLAMQQYFWRWTLISDIGKSKLPKKIWIKPPLHPVMVFMLYSHALSDWTMRQGHFNEQWTSYWRNSSGYLPLSV